MRTPWVRRSLYEQKVRELESLREQASVALKEAEACRAMLMMLRVYQTQHEGRSGFAVTCFIPGETVDRIRNKPERRRLFVIKVAKRLVERAILGMLHVTQPGNRVAMVTFEKLGKDGLVSSWLENKKRPVIMREVNRETGRIEKTTARDSLGSGA